MTQFQQEYALYRNRYFWSVIGVVLLIAFMTVNVAHAGQIVLQLIFVHADTQMVDTDGDGRLDPFSADVIVFDDGTAEGTIAYTNSSNLVLKRGLCRCESSSEPTIVLFATQQQIINGRWVEVGEAEIEVQQNPDNAAGGMMLSIKTVDSYSNFEAEGQIVFDTIPGDA